MADIVKIIRPLEEAGILLERSQDRLEHELGRFFVAEVDGTIAGCCALIPAGMSAELACLAVHSAHRGCGTGGRLLAAAADAARAAGIDRLFVFTTQARDWFIKNGFTEAASDVLPETYKMHHCCIKLNAKILTKPLAP